MVSKITSTQKQDKFRNSLSNEARFFLEPHLPKQRQYEALRAYFVEECPAKVVAERFSYTPGAFHVLCHQFRNDPERRFFVETKRGQSTVQNGNAHEIGLRFFGRKITRSLISSWL